MQPAPLVPAHGQRHVDALLGEAPVELGPLELRLARSHRSLDPFAGGIQRHPRLAVPHLPQGELELALAPEIRDAHGLDLVRRRRRGDRREGRLLERLDVHRTSEATK